MKWTDETYDGKKLYIGKYCVAYVNKSFFRDIEKNYSANCRLPGIKDFLGYYPDVKSAAEKIDRAVGVWLMNTGLQEK